MKVLNTIKKIIYSSTFVFTVTVFVMALFYKMASNPDTPDTSGIQMDKYLPLYLFSLIIGALDHLLTWKKLPLAVRLGIHFAGTLASVYVFFVVIFKLGQTSHGRFSFMLISAIAYMIVLGICCLLRRGFLKLCGAMFNTSEKKAPKQAETTESEESDAE